MVDITKYSKLISKTAFMKMANDEDDVVRYFVAKNCHITEILAKLAEDEDDDVREAVAENPNTTAEILAKLAEDEEWWIRKAVAANPNTPVEILVKLVKDEDGDVSKATFNHLQKLEDISSNELLDVAGGAEDSVKTWVLTRLKEQMEKGLI